MIKQQIRKLTLNRETIKTLQRDALAAVAGGVVVTTVDITVGAACPTLVFTCTTVNCGGSTSERGW